MNGAIILEFRYLHEWWIYIIIIIIIIIYCSWVVTQWQWRNIQNIAKQIMNSLFYRIQQVPSRLGWLFAPCNISTCWVNEETSEHFYTRL